mmetsp:Transcript_110589/g.276994  ORF Transcript_110589/g.276994 Transcript_110589/m.276994 type:complete len:218 (+) Transcript_110589:254-907(+)
MGLEPLMGFEATPRGVTAPSMGFEASPRGVAARAMVMLQGMESGLFVTFAVRDGSKPVPTIFVVLGLSATAELKRRRPGVTGRWALLVPLPPEAAKPRSSSIAEGAAQDGSAASGVAAAKATAAARFLFEDDGGRRTSPSADVAAGGDKCAEAWLRGRIGLATTVLEDPAAAGAGEGGAGVRGVIGVLLGVAGGFGVSNGAVAGSPDGNELGATLQC